MRILLVVPFLFILGCSEASKPVNPQAAKPVRENNVKLAVDGITGRAAVNAGTQAMGRVRDISAKENKDLDEVMK